MTPNSWLYTASLGISVGPLVIPNDDREPLVWVAPFVRSKLEAGATPVVERKTGHNLLIQNPQFDNTGNGITDALEQLLAGQVRSETFVGSFAVHEALVSLRARDALDNGKYLLEALTACTTSMWA